jgi:hypothetical protein
MNVFTYWYMIHDKYECLCMMIHDTYKHKNVFMYMMIHDTNIHTNVFTCWYMIQTYIWMCLHDDIWYMHVHVCTYVCNGLYVTLLKWREPTNSCHSYLQRHNCSRNVSDWLPANCVVYIWLFLSRFELRLWLCLPLCCRFNCQANSAGE